MADGSIGGVRCPREFRYWEAIDARWVRAARAACRRVLGFDPAPSDEVVRAFASMYYDADPVAEDFAREVWSTRGFAAARELLDRALAEGMGAIDDPPPALVRLFEELDRDPPWLDRALVEQGAKVFRRYGPDVFRFAGAVTLQAYSESSVAKPLALSGAYTGASARRRFLETVSFWIAVSEPGGLAHGAPGRAAALRARMMHVVVRQRLLAHREWDLDAWGVPISQADATLTLMGGSFVPGLAMQVMGYRPSVRDIEAMMHFWRYVGHLMGVRPRWYPSSMTEAAQLLFVSMMKGARTAGEDGRRLCRSYVDAFAPSDEAPLATRLREAIDHKVHVGFTRFFLPPPTYRDNALPPAGPWALLPILPFPFVFAAETLRRAFPALDAVADGVARRRRDRWLARHSRGRRAEFRPPERLTR